MSATVGRHRGDRERCRWTPRFRRLAHLAPALTVAAALAVATTAAGCGGSSGAAGTGTSPAVAREASALVQPPKLTLSGCQYEVDNVIPPGEPKGGKAPFAPFTPDPSAVAALRQIQQHGGTGVVDSFTLPSGTTLFTGPSTSAAKAGVIPAGHSVLAADPVLWTDQSGHDWLAFFLICGGDDLYWLDVEQVLHHNPRFGQSLAQTIAQLRSALPYTRTGMISLLPLRIDGSHRFAWVAPSISFSPARGQYLNTAST
jgi:hypothetical protein